MSSYVEVIALLVFASFAAAVLAYLALLIWAVFRRERVVAAVAVPTAGGLVVQSDPFKVGLLWTSLLILIPLLVLALWAVGVEMSSRRVGFGLVFGIVHAFLLWQLIRVGAHVQRKIVLSRWGLVVHPVFGPSREVAWSAIERVEDITYTGPGVGGLYMYTSDGSCVVLDRWLPNWESLEDTVYGLTRSAKWTRQRRFALG
jgi:hypothetical protein